MRFKLYYNEKNKKLDINCLTDNFSEVIIPENLDQHIHFPIPNNMVDEIKKYLGTIISQEDSKQLEDICQDMINLTKKRKETINKLKEKYNPIIIKKCEEFKDDNAEWFI